ncbi:MAG: pyruvate dehydrogenase (acetyl-transferring) E1 component subunit alpha [Sweet potato little leaf phytoplasma]|uniref:Pyruvate dehydrogenase E1 component subunit alpha n=2 Tax=Acholeplasmataceae TaxID=2146 RepID=A0ABT9CZP0_9MOLU|nr:MULTISPECIES: pyruvate dehydrogenase (acetyl-transferring) E1 component subunit alpha [Phytoplasma]MDV3139158.1 pyruvate dehydrogenase (acetyl-transferring) E1 component subunit alpha [Candidatus Phytoplasma australasiaticum]MDO7987098.1 pyruvate dehydrogenase (acetyl-transferring) E1 component subunit alpha [Sweet potato little leaf phytoplasma]MDO8005210.1 pyruvate dehydrogenase (acetyl-transferring) E1 component subunit alpha [Sweet potato little leaf phytoplasma]MDO8008669.1 pyruvate deh
MLQVLDEQGFVINSEFEPNLSNEELLKIYEFMVFTRETDTAAFQYQRQGRMLSYVLNTGHEACQIGIAAACADNDWISPYFRDLGMFLYRGVSVENILLYWYGNERGSAIEAQKRILPVNIIIGSSINIGAGLALASKLDNKRDVTIATIGDGGTASEEFAAGLNYAAVFQVPLVVAIQNNQYAISTPRKVACYAESLAQKAIAFGIPGIRVDGNDILAVYTAAKHFIESARNGNGPSLLELYTYRLLGHTTNDNPSLYRSKSEEEEWFKKEPISRFQKYLINKNILTDELINKIKQNVIDKIKEAHKRILTYANIVEPKEVFEHTYETMTPQLKMQLHDYESFLKSTEEGK